VIRSLSKAFSSEVETGSRQENASNQESRAPFRFNRNGQGSRTRFEHRQQPLQTDGARKSRVARMQRGQDKSKILRRYFMLIFWAFM
jgi:hypothetical protein